MNLPRSYEIVAPLTVFEVLRVLGRTDRRKIEEFLQRLVRQPSLPADFADVADKGTAIPIQIGQGSEKIRAIRAIRGESFSSIDCCSVPLPKFGFDSA